MKFLKVTTNDKKRVIINLQNVSYFYAISGNQTNICFLNEKDYLTIDLSIEDFEFILNSLCRCDLF